MSQWWLIVSEVLKLFGIVGIGAGARQVGWLTREADQSLLKLVIRVLLPALILDVILGTEYAGEMKKGVFTIMNHRMPREGALSMHCSATAGLVAALAGVRIGLRSPEGRRTFAFSVGMYNYGYVPIPLAAALFGKDTTAVLFVHNMGVELALWGVGIVVLSGGFAAGWWKRLLNPPLLAIVAGLGCNATGLDAHVPRFIASGIAMLGSCAIPVALLLIGATILDQWANVSFRTGLGVMSAACVLRLLVLPVAFLALAWIVPGTIELKRVMVLEAAMPAAVFPIVLSRHYHGDPPTAVRVAVATQVLSLVTMPLWLSAALPWLESLGS